VNKDIRNIPQGIGLGGWVTKEPQARSDRAREGGRSERSGGSGSSCVSGPQKLPMTWPAKQQWATARGRAWRYRPLTRPLTARARFCLIFGELGGEAGALPCEHGP
jgi:hypothetical protein